MGNCVAQKARANQQRNTNKIQIQPKLCTENQGVSTKYLLYKSIQNQDIDTTKRLRYFFNVDPNEEVSIKGYFWTAIHYAAFFGATAHLEFFLKLAYMENKEQFEDIVNLQTIENYTPLMIAAMNGRRSIIEQILSVGGVKINLKDSKGRTAKDLAKNNGKGKCVELLEEVEKKGVQHLPINEAFFKNLASIRNFSPFGKQLQGDEEDDPQNLELVTKGKLIPCAICQENTGLLKYSKCCGQPLHLFCVEDKIQNCPYCKATCIDLINEIYYPDRAFEL